MRETSILGDIELARGPIGGVGPLAGKSSVVGGHKQRQAFVQLALPATTVAPASSATSGCAAWVEISSASGVVVRVPGSNLAALQIVLNSLNRAGQESQHV